MPFQFMKQRDAPIDHTYLLTSGGRGILRGIHDSQHCTGYGWDTPTDKDEHWEPYTRRSTRKPATLSNSKNPSDLSKYAPYLVGAGVLVGAYYLISNS